MVVVVVVVVVLAGMGFPLRSCERGETASGAAPLYVLRLRRCSGRTPESRSTRLVSSALMSLFGCPNLPTCTS